MHARVMSGIPAITDAEFLLFQRLFRERIGLHLSEQKKFLLQGRLSKRLLALGMGCFRDYHHFLNSAGGSDELETAIGLVTTHETYFFREAHHLEHLRQLALGYRSNGKPLRVWSAASSTGQEPYSIAMVLHDCLGDSGWEILATDISEDVLETARSGLYPMQRIEGIPPDFLKRYCLRGNGEYQGQLLIDRALRQRINFQVMNLMHIPQDLQLFDAIFLRNVIIYFETPTKKQVVNNIVSHLSPQGLLFVGHSESLVGLGVSLCSVKPSVYRKQAQPC